VTSSGARIGETLPECKARYGNVIRVELSRPDYPQYCFRKGDIEIRVRLLNGRSGAEVFTGKYGRMSQAQISEMLAANSGGFEWKQAAPENFDKETYSAQWRLLRSDGIAHAEYVSMAHLASDILTIETSDFQKVFRAAGTGF
jgi:hypothetical protein